MAHTNSTAEQMDIRYDRTRQTTVSKTLSKCSSIVPTATDMLLVRNEAPQCIAVGNMILQCLLTLNIGCKFYAAHWGLPVNKSPSNGDNWFWIVPGHSLPSCPFLNPALIRDPSHIPPQWKDKIKSFCLSCLSFAYWEQKYESPFTCMDWIA